MSNCANSRSQEERLDVLRRFRNNAVDVLLATDVAARGLDVKDIRVVVNYSVPKDIEVPYLIMAVITITSLQTYIHRIGRTGRMGIEGIMPGTAFTLLTQEDKRFATQLIKQLRASFQNVPEDLVALAGSYEGRVQSVGSNMHVPSPKEFGSYSPQARHSANSKQPSTIGVTTLPGFVRASATYSSSVSNNSNPARKASRWS